MKKMLLMLSVAALLGCAGTKDVYMFTSHREPALDGLHFLYSHDGLHWDSLPGSWLRPQIGNKELYRNYATGKMETPKYHPNSMMRDPSILQGPDGTFHLLWTLSWAGEKGFGYASSKDLIHWSEQRKVMVMADSLTNNVWAPELFYDEGQKLYYIIPASDTPRPTNWAPTVATAPIIPPRATSRPSPQRSLITTLGSTLSTDSCLNAASRTMC